MPLGDTERVLAFLGIPYAAPPTGENRFRPPGDAPTWSGTRDATQFGAACWQPMPATDTDRFYGTGPATRSEDCLFLNLWTGAKSPDAQLAVMVWIHGGAWMTGQSDLPTYDGEALARQDVVLVSLNYRLGPLGFLAHNALSEEHAAASTPERMLPPVSGHYGLLDQIAALEWVRDNIAAFGGNPENVTIFGESAGAWSVNMLSASPLSKGLFHRAIAQSGGLFWPQESLEQAQRRGAATAEALGVSPALAAGPEGLEALRAATPEELLATMPPGAFPQPYIDGWLLEDSIYSVFESGKHNDVDFMLGFNRDEATALFAQGAPRNVAQYRQWLSAEYGDFADDFFGVYGAATDARAQLAYLGNMADRFFGWQMRTWADFAARGDSRVFTYYFTHAPPIPEQERYGAFHAAEIPYAFGNLDQPAATGTALAEAAWTDQDLALSSAMVRYWTSFAKSGNPNPAGTPQAMRWPRYDAERGNALELGTEIREVTPFRSSRLDVFDAYFASQRR